MKKLSVFILVFMNISFIAGVVGCNSDNPNKEKRSFYYYPDKNVYYDVANKAYVYSIDGAKTWSVMQSDSTIDTAFLGKKEIIYSDADSIWKDNSTHIKNFSGTLINIVNEDTSTEVAATPVGERKLAKKGSKAKSTKQRARIEKGKKQPVRDFFKKIFGKKKRNENNP